MNDSNIYQKLVEVRKSVPYLKKENAGYQFKYVSSSQTLGALREAMDIQGLLLIPKITREEVRDHTTRKGDHEYFTILNVEFTWVNIDKPEEMVICPWYGQGLDDGEKGVGKALTYAEKFFLLKFFNIATDKDDPDSFQKKEDGQSHEVKPKNTPQTYQKANEQAKPPAEGKKDLRAEIDRMVNDMIDDVALRDVYLIEKSTYEYKVKDANKQPTGEIRTKKGTPNVNEISEGALPVVYGKIKKDFEAWRAK